MRRYAVRLVPSVEVQILDQVLYIADDSIDGALAWEARLRAAIDAIGDAPAHALDDELSERVGRPVRRAAFEGTYLIHYEVDDAAGVVRVVNFRHGARLG